MIPMPVESSELNQAPVPTSVPVAPRPRELDIFAFILMLLRHLHFILGCGLLAAIFTAVNMLHLKPRYAATAVMIVPQGSVSAVRGSQPFSISTLDLLGRGYELYIDMIRSRTIADRIIDDYDLKSVYGTKDLDIAEAQLAGMTTVESQREGVVRVTVQDSSPQRAAALANDYFRQLDLLNSHLVLTSVGQERAYLERELFKEKDALADAEVALKQVQESTSGVPPDAAASAQLGALESTRAQLRADQVHLSALLTGDTDANPEVIRVRSEIAGLSSQLEELQRGAASNSNGIPTTQVPEQTLIYTRRLRDVKFHEELYGLLERQFEEAKQEEAKTPTIVQVLDPAVPSIRKTWPHRTSSCIMAGIFGTIAGVFLVSFWALVRAYVRNPVNAKKLEQLKTLYRRRSEEQF